MNKYTFNFTFFCLLLYFNSISTLTTNNKIKPVSTNQPQQFTNLKKQVAQINNKLNINQYEQISINRVDNVVDSFSFLSKKYPLQYFLIIFSTDNHNFPFNLKPIKAKLNVYKYYLLPDTNENYDNNQFTEIYLIQDGQIKEKSKKSFGSGKFGEYSNYLIQTYNLDQEEVKPILPFKSFLSTGEDIEEKDEVKPKGEKNKRLIRFLFSLVLVVIFIIGLFFLVKYSIDWATSGKNEINKLREQKLREVTEKYFN